MGSDTVKTSGRIVWLDIARGVAMFLVILGHAIRQEMRADNELCFILFRTIYLFHMNLFFFLSGYAHSLTKKKTDKMSISEFITKKVKSLLVPWFVYSMLIYVVFFVLSKIPTMANILKGTSYEYMNFFEYFVQIFKGNNPYAYHMWFLYILFWVTIIVFIVERLVGNQKRSRYILAVIAVVFLVLRAFVVYDSIWVVMHTCNFFIWFYFGTLFNDNVAGKLSWKTSAFSVISLIMMFVFHNYYYDFQSQTVIRGFLLLIVSVFILGTVIGAVRLSIYVAAKGENIIKKFFAYVGKNTMAIYLLHQQLCCAILGLVLYNKMHLPIIVVMIACVVSSVIVPMAIVHIAKKLKLGRVLEVLFAIK